jgi:predicted enzyme related to lactoylglutathione lyase
VAGPLVHFEIRAGDFDRAKRFWTGLLAWKVSEWQEPVQYSLIDTGKDPGGGMYPTDSPDRGILVYFGVDDLDAALTHVRELGGTIEEGKQAVPGTGWFARCRDSEGNEFSLFQADERVTSG